MTETNEIEELHLAIAKGMEKAIEAFDKELEKSNFDIPYSIQIEIVEMYLDDGLIPHKTYKIRREP